MADCAPNTPVLVGVGAVQQKMQDYREALEPVALDRVLQKGGDEPGGAGSPLVAGGLQPGEAAPAPKTQAEGTVLPASA